LLFIFSGKEKIARLKIYFKEEIVTTESIITSTTAHFNINLMIGFEVSWHHSSLLKLLTFTCIYLQTITKTKYNQIDVKCDNRRIKSVYIFGRKSQHDYFIRIILVKNHILAHDILY